MVALTIKASSFQFDGKPYSVAFNAAITRLFRGAAKEFFKAAIAKVSVRTGFVRGAFGVLGDLVGEGSSGGPRSISRLRKAYLINKKIEHVEATIARVKEFESGAARKDERSASIRDVNRSGVVESEVESITKGSQTRDRRKERKKDLASGEGTLDELRQGSTSGFAGLNKTQRAEKALLGKGDESQYTSEQVREYEERRRAGHESDRAEIQNIHSKEREALQKAEYTRQRERLEARLEGLKARGKKLAASIESATPTQRGTLAGLEALRQKASIEKPAGPFQAEAVSAKKKISLREAAKGARSGGGTQSPKQVRLAYLRKKRDEALGVYAKFEHPLAHLPGKRGERYAKKPLQYARANKLAERKKLGLGKIEFYHAPDGTVTLKTPSSGRNFAYVSLPGSQQTVKETVPSSSTINAPAGNIIAGSLNIAGATVNSLQGLKNVYEFAFGINISYFNINDVTSNKYTPSAPWQAMADGRLAFKKYIESNYTDIPSIVSFLIEVEYELHTNGSITKREKRIV